MHTVARLVRHGGRVGRILLFLVLLGSGSYAVADPLFDPLRDFLVQRLTRYVTGALKGSLEVGALRGSLLGSPVLQNIILRDEQGVVVGQIDELRLTFSTRALLKKRLEIETAEAVGLQVTLTQDPNGQLNVVNLLSPAEPASPTDEGGTTFAIIIDNLHIRDSHLTLRLPALAGVQQLTALEARLSIRLDDTGFTMQVQDLSAQASPAAVALRTVQGGLQTGNGALRLDNLRLQTDESTVLVNGALPDAAQETHLTLQMQPLDLAEVGRLVDNPSLRGDVQLALQVDGPQEALQLRGELITPAGRLDTQGQLNAAVTPPSYQATLALTNVDLAALVADLAWHTDLNMQLAVAGAGLTPAALRSEVRLQLQPSRLGDIALRPSEIHLDIANQRVAVRQLRLDSTVAAMTASGVFDLQGTTDLTYALTAQLAELRSVLDTAGLAGDVRTRGQLSGTWPALSAQGTLEASALRYDAHRIESLRLTYEASQLGAQPQVTAQLVTGDARIGTVPVAQVELEGTYQGSERQLHFRTTVVQSSTSGGQTHGTLSLAETGQQVRLEELQVRVLGRPWQATAPIEVAFGPQGVHIVQFHLVHAEESLRLSGALQGEQLQDIRLDLTQLDLSYWQQLLPLPEAVDGHATLQAQLSGTRAEPHFQAELTVQPGDAQRLPFSRYHNVLVYTPRQLQATGRVYQEDREVLTLQASLPLDLGLIDLPLTQRLLEAPVEVRMRLNTPDLAAVHRWQPTLPRLAGTMQGALDLQGTYTTLTLESTLTLQQLGIAGLVTQLSAPIQLTSTLVTAPSMAALRQGIEQRQLTPHLPQLTLRIPTLDGRVLVSEQVNAAPAAPPAPPAVQRTATRRPRKAPGRRAPARGKARSEAVPQTLPPVQAPRREQLKEEPVQIRNLVLQAAAQWTPQGPQATLERLDLQASGFGLPSTDVQLAAQLTPQRLNLTRLRLRAAPSEVRGQGYLTFPEQQVQLRLDLPHLQLSLLPFDLPPELPSVVQGSLSVRGSMASPQVEARLQYAGAQIEADVSAQLQEPLPRYQATLRIDGLAIAQVLPQAQGFLQARAQLQGSGVTAAQRQATLAMTVETTDFTLVPGLTAQLQATLNGTALHLDQLQVRSTPVTLTASGSLASTGPAALQYRLTLGDLSPLQPLLGVPVQASGGLTGTLQGPLNDLRARGSLQLDTWRVADLRGQRLQATVTADHLPTAPQVTLRAQIPEVQGPSLPPSAINVEGTYAAQQGTFSAAVTTGPYQRTRLAGNVYFNAGQRLTLHTVRLQHRDLVWENSGPVEVARSPQGTVQVQRFRLRSGPQTIQAQGTLEPQGTVRAEVEVQALRLLPTAQAFAPELTIPDGRLDLRLDLGGTVQQPQVQGTARLTALRWQERDLGSIQATLGLSGTTLQTEVRWQAQGDEILQARGTMQLDAAQPLDLQLQAPAVNLAILPALVPAVTASAGTLSLDLQVRGTLEQPQLSGVLLVRDGMLQPEVTGTRYGDIQGRLLFANNLITIERLQVGSPTGPLQLVGWIEHAGITLRQADLVLQADEFTAMNTPAVDAVVSTQISIRGSQREILAAGNLTLVRAHVRVDDLPGTGPKAVQPWELTIAGVYGPGPDAVATSSGPSETPVQPTMLLPALRADIRVDVPRHVWLQAPSTAVELSGNVHVTKDTDAPLLLVGRLETVRGHVGYYGKKFTVERGLVIFTGTPEIAPRLDVVVSKDISDYTVFIAVTGTPQAPRITFSSTPELPESDVISLLILGKTTDRLTKGERNALATEAQQLAGGVLAGQLEKVLAPSLGLETIDISAGKQLGTGSIRVGRYVAEDLFLSVGREFGSDESATNVELEYSFSRRLKLRASGSDRGETAVDVLWRIEY